MTPTVPYIPDNAPFTPEQRAWLNGFLAGIFSSAPASQQASVRPSHRIAILYASQSGTAEGLARKLAKELKSAGHVPSVSTLVGYTPAALASEDIALLLASTYGDGDPPDGVQPFYEQLCLEHFPRMEKLSYAVFALGDRHYEHFCKFGSDLDAKIAALGANQLLKRVDCDVDVDVPFAEWKQAVLARLEEFDHLPRKKVSGPAPVSTQPEGAQGQSSAEPSASTTAKPYSRENPLLAPLVDKRALTHPRSSKVTLHLAFSTAGTGLKYEAGDAFGVIPKNDPNLVAEILQLLRCNGNEQVPNGKGGMTTLHDALSTHFQLTRLNRKLVQEYAKRGESQLTELLAPEQQANLEKYVYDRGLIDLLVECPGMIDAPEDLVAILPRLTPRLYSISSSPLTHGQEIHATVAVVRYSSHNRERGGVCSTLFADRTDVSDRLPIYIQPNKKFKIPADPDESMIMIGPGTGIAPFRGFLHERRALGHKGRNWLFFGERSVETDFLYQDELLGMHKDGHLTRLDTAFSRDQEKRIYVQHRMAENSAALWSWLQEGAGLYVCGDAKQMAKDVHSTLCSIAEKEGGMSPDQAQEYFAGLKEQHRYHRDVY
ncbi:MAG: flavodoxin domain-containing protein [Acidobacteriota bacterium]|nr:flavodoxin domain-containing protein [Acidobacteriota bacterium]